ncbi:MAG: DUF4395 family protein [Nitrospira sp.]
MNKARDTTLASVTAVDRRRIEAQGFLGLDDRQIGQIKFWLRLSPAICMTWTAWGTVLQSAPVLWALAPFALLGALLPGHPFDLLYTFGIRRLTGGPALPRYPLPRRFACLLATLMIVGAAWSFQSGWILAGQLFGWGLVGAALVNVTTGFCIPSFIYGLLFGPPGSCQVE